MSFEERNSADGRNINTDLAILTGEGSAQRSHEEPFKGVPSGRFQYSPDDPTYYDRPIIKKSPWSWTIPAYYFVGGVAGGSAVLAGAATILGKRGYGSLIVRSRWIGTVGAAVSAGLLVHDLGRPERFLNMLRVFRPTSPMNIGTWILTAFSGATGASAIATLGPRWTHPAGDAAGAVASVLGLPLATYTGVLVSHTAVPLWNQAHRLLPLLFVASAAASAASVYDFFEWNEREQRAIHFFGNLGKVAELACTQAVEVELDRIPAVSEPLHNGFSGALWKTAKVLSAASLVLALAPWRSRRKDRIVAVLGTAGAICLRFGIHYAGQRSADNPRATFHQQRRNRE